MSQWDLMMQYHKAEDSAPAMNLASEKLPEELKPAEEKVSYYFWSLGVADPIRFTPRKL